MNRQEGNAEVGLNGRAAPRADRRINYTARRMLTLEPALDQQICEIAETEDRPITRVLRQAVREFVERHEATAR